MGTVLSDDLDQRPVSTSTEISKKVPIVDLSNYIANGKDKNVERLIISACEKWGFFQVINHGISKLLVDRMICHTRDFFARTADEKLKVCRSADNPWGYYNNELTKNQRDKKEVFDFTRKGRDPIYHSENRWPLNDPDFEATSLEYFDSCSKLAFLLAGVFWKGLGLEANFMASELEDSHTSFVRLNYYPVRDPLSGQNVEHLQLADRGVHHHTDAGILTILLQDLVGGLQVFNDGYWHAVEPIEGALVINTADMTQVISNDRYQAAVHRVLAMENQDRYSIPFFFNPSAHSIISSDVGEKRSDENSLYKPISWSDFRGKRTEGDYADYGDEVQISQYRIQQGIPL